MSGKRFYPDSRPTVQLCLLAIALASALFSGCGDRSGRQAIEGTVSLDGKPLEKGQISFRPQQGTASPSAGGKITSGKFSIAPERGLLPGKFRVEITASRPTGEKAVAPITGKMVTIQQQYLPAKYNEQSQLEASVGSGGPNRFEIRPYLEIIQPARLDGHAGSQLLAQERIKAMSHCVKTFRIDRLQMLFSSTLLLTVVCHGIQAQETRPIGKTAEDQKRNAVLLDGYDYGKYLEAITGYTGQDRQRIAALQYRHAVRTRVGPRGNYKGGMAALADGKLVLATCRREKEGSLLFIIHVYLSADQGLTWEEIGKTPLVGKEPSLTALPDGLLIMTAQELRDPMKMWLYRSSDGGRTWETDTLPGQDYPRNLIVEPNGSD